MAGLHRLRQTLAGQTAIGRYKSIIGPRLRARLFPAQQTEAAIGCAVLNRMLACARPKSVRRNKLRNSHVPSKIGCRSTPDPCTTLFQRRSGSTRVLQAGIIGYWGKHNTPRVNTSRLLGTLRQEDTYRTGSRRILAASLAQLGRLEEARQEAEMFMVSNPHFTISHWASTQPFRDEAMRAHFINGCFKAGLPE